MLVAIQTYSRRQNIFEMALPSMPSLVGSGAVEYSLIGRALQVEIERGVDAETRAMDLVHAVLMLQLPPHLLDEVGRLAVGWRLQMQAQRRSLRVRCLLRGDLAVVQHLLEH